MKNENLNMKGKIFRKKFTLTTLYNDQERHRYQFFNIGICSFLDLNQTCPGAL